MDWVTWPTGGFTTLAVTIGWQIARRIFMPSSPSLWHKTQGLVGKIRTLYLVEADNQSLSAALVQADKDHERDLERARTRAQEDQAEIDHLREVIRNLRVQLAECRCLRE